MIGNDIIDLDLARKESNWKRKGFLNKIFTAKEQLHIKNSDNQEVMVWNLWSRKEAAYKIFNRQTQIRGFFPLLIECFDMEIVNGISIGKVQIKEQVYFTKTNITPQLVCTIAVENFNHFEKIKKLKNRKNIQKTAGIPSLFEKGQYNNKPVSISNHGRFEQVITL